MPTYQYSCNDCGAQHDIVQSMSDPTLTECPACGGQMRKLFGNVGVVFKGSGFYRTDSREKSSASSTSSDTKSDAKSDAKSGTKSDGKSGTPTASTSTASTSSSGSSTSTAKPAATSS